jgi:ribosome recycling factor
MAYDLKQFDTRAGEVSGWLSREFTGIRTGRATPALLDLVAIEAYGSRMPINQVGSVSVEDARTIRVSIWDQSMLRSVEKAIVDADLGVSVVTDSSGLRVIFPPLTTERRVQLQKLAKAKLEEARVSVRGIRDDVMKEIDTMHKNGEMSDDERFGTREGLQKRVDAANQALQNLFEVKEKEIAE